MFWFSIAQCLSFIFDLLTLPQLTDQQKDIQILLLRQQLRVLQRKALQPKHFSRFDKTLLSILVARLRQISTDFQSQIETILIFKPETVLKWHRALVKQKWTFKRVTTGGRPTISTELTQVILRMARENNRCGYDRIEGKLLKLGYQVDRSTIRNVLKKHRILPVPKRRPGAGAPFYDTISIRCLPATFLQWKRSDSKPGMCCSLSKLEPDSFTLPGIQITQTAHGSRNWHGSSAGKSKTGKQKCAISFTTEIAHSAHCLIGFFASQQIQVIHTLFRAPNANAHVERCIRSIRKECLDQLIILNRDHLERVVQEYSRFYNQRRPHQGLGNRLPEGNAEVPAQGSIHRRSI